MAKIIGLTGGIGSGKSTIAQYFQTKGIPVYIADDESRKITQTAEVIASINEKFGTEIFDDGILNRRKLAALVFENRQQLQQLNAIIHPHVKKHFDSWVNSHSNFPVVIKEAAILFESGSYEDCDKIITVIAPLELRLGRIIDRDKISRESAISRVNNQWTDEQRIARSDFIIENIDLEMAKRQADEILKKLMIQ